MKDPYPVPPFTTPVRGSVTVPGSKSITNRALIIAALADGQTLLENCLFSEDTEIMVQALLDLGFEIEAEKSAKTIRVNGLGGQIPRQQAELFVGNSGTSARFLTAFCCLARDGDYTLDGVPQMRKRPMSDLVECLNQLGAKIEASNGFAPLRIRANGLDGGATAIDASSSSQFVSALAMVAPYARDGIKIEMSNRSVRRGYIDMTLAMLKQFGIAPEKLSALESEYKIEPSAPFAPKPEGYLIEGDASAASYFFALPVAVGGQVEIHGVTKDSLQGDIAFANRMEEAGASVEWKQRSAICRFPVQKKGQALHGSFYAYSDTFLTAAALAPLLEGTSRIEGIEHTRHQECDRIHAMASGLLRLGQSVEEEDGSLTVRPSKLDAGQVETFHDHRVAMSFAVLGSRPKSDEDPSPWLSIEDPTCCKKTFPDFFDVLEDLRQQSMTPRKDFIVVAIDGGAAAGKSSTSRALSNRFQLMHVDTGSFYRATTLKLREANVKPESGDALVKGLASLQLDTAISGNSASIVINGWIPDDSIRTKEINENVSHYAALPEVRSFLLDYQRSLAEFARQQGFAGLVMEGRDIGSVIFPDADLRLFLYADPAKRAARRAAEGISDSIEARDKIDSCRKAAPLARPEGATLVDSSEMSLDEVVAHVSSLVENAYRSS